MQQNAIVMEERKRRLVHNRIARRYELELEDGRALIEYTERPGDVLVLTRTEVPAGYEDKGVGSELVRAVLEEVRRNRMRVVPQCRFVAQWIYCHPEWECVVAREAVQ